ncbi:MAG: sulfotransferase domain-containing protein [Chloroflexi bacterium]|nr:sulfotransferase domain-containing protein [Chloroflexota bacterium]
MNTQSRVDCIGIGVQRSATTWLFESITQHPQLMPAQIPNDKELNFFNHNWEKGIYWYHHLFEFGPWKTIEYSTLYFHDRNVPERIYKYNSAAKLILMVRNPIDRALSQHKHEIRRNRLPEELYDFSRAMEQNPSYVEQGRYATHLDNYLQFFGPSQVHIVLYDDVGKDAEGVLKGLFSFLGVAPDFKPANTSKRVNVAKAQRNQSLSSILGLSRTIRGVAGEAPVKLLKATGLPGLLRRTNEIEIDDRLVPPMSDEARAYIHSELDGEVLRLEKAIGRDLSHWRQPRQPDTRG